MSIIVHCILTGLDVIILNSELLTGTLDKSTLGSGSKNNIYLQMLRTHSSQEAIDAMWRLCRLVPFFLTNRGFSLGISDVTPSHKLDDVKKKRVAKGYRFSISAPPSALLRLCLVLLCFELLIVLILHTVLKRLHLTNNTVLT